MHSNLLLFLSCFKLQTLLGEEKSLKILRIFSKTECKKNDINASNYWAWSTLLILLCQKSGAEKIFPFHTFGVQKKYSDHKKCYESPVTLKLNVAKHGSLKCTEALAWFYLPLPTLSFPSRSWFFFSKIKLECKCLFKCIFQPCSQRETAAFWFL